MHYIIRFDEEVGGYDQYEYSANNMIATERYYGDRYLVLFNKDIDKAELIQKEDILINPVQSEKINYQIMDKDLGKRTPKERYNDNVVVLIFLLRKKIYLWLTKLEKKMNSFIIYQ